MKREIYEYITILTHLIKQRKASKEAPQVVSIAEIFSYFHELLCIAISVLHYVVDFLISTKAAMVTFIYKTVFNNTETVFLKLFCGLDDNVNSISA